MMSAYRLKADVMRLPLKGPLIARIRHLFLWLNQDNLRAITGHIAYNDTMRLWACIIALLLITGLCKGARAECTVGYVELFDPHGEPVCVSEGYLRTQQQIQDQKNRNTEKRMQGDMERQREKQPQTEAEIRQRKFQDALIRDQRKRVLQQRPP